MRFRFGKRKARGVKFASNNTTPSLIFCGEKEAATFVAELLQAAHIPASLHVDRNLEVRVLVSEEASAEAHQILAALGWGDSDPKGAIASASVAHLRRGLLRAIELSDPRIGRVYAAVRSGLGGPLLMLYLGVGVIYQIGRERLQLIESGALFPVFAVLAIGLYAWFDRGLDPTERIVFREWRRCRRRQRVWTNVLASFCGAVMVVASLVSFDDARSPGAVLLILLPSAALMVGGLVLLVWKTRLAASRRSTSFRWPSASP